MLFHKKALFAIFLQLSQMVINSHKYFSAVVEESPRRLFLFSKAWKVLKNKAQDENKCWYGSFAFLSFVPSS